MPGAGPGGEGVKRARRRRGQTQNLNIERSRRDVRHPSNIKEERGKAGNRLGFADEEFNILRLNPSSSLRRKKASRLEG